MTSIILLLLIFVAGAVSGQAAMPAQVNGGTTESHRVIVDARQGLSSPAGAAGAATGPRSGGASSPQPAPSAPAKAPATEITLDQAIALALANSPSLQAIRTQISQSQADEVTAGLRPNPTLNWDSQFVPIFNPGQFSTDTLSNFQQFDLGVGYLFERGHKRQLRSQAARNQTDISRSQVADAERTLALNVATQFIDALLAKSNLQFAVENLDSFRQTVNLSEEQYRAGEIGEGDLLKIRLQMLQFQTDVASQRVAQAQALAALRQLIGYSSVPRDFGVAGDLVNEPLKGNEDDMDALALRQRADLRAARQGVTLAGSEVALARANGKQDLGTQLSYSHVGGLSSASLFFNIPIPVFDRNQGEIAKSNYALTQAQLNVQAAEQGVLTDVETAYESVASQEQILGLYTSGYLKQAQDSRDISQYAYTRGAATLLDLLDAERSYRSTQLAYRQALAVHMLSMEQLRSAVGTRNLP
jgi:cobalt-zinc-cadmium efflux system outer membrane protein